MFDNENTEAPVCLNSEGRGIDIGAPCPGCGCLITQTIPWSAVVRMYRRDSVHPWRQTRRGYQVAFRCPTCPSKNASNPQCGWIVVDIEQGEVCEWHAIRVEQQSGA